jgi:AmmeMemoRadiSam system protein B
MNPAVRAPAVAGAFYPGNSAKLAADVKSLVADAPRGAGHPQPKAIIAPHAGYIYSGSTAADAYARLEPWRDTIRRVVLLGPTHRVPVRGLAASSAEFFATPLGQVPIDREALDTLADLPQVAVSDPAHAWEHSLEVHLPFLQTVLGEFSLLPLAVGHASADEVAEVLDRLWGGPETLFVISSDLSHYLAYATACKTDRATCEDILRLDPHIDPHQACGAYPINGLLVAARRHGLKPEMIHLCNSGDTAGDRDRVVGYAAFAFYEDTPHG